MARARSRICSRSRRQARGSRRRRGRWRSRETSRRQAMTKITPEHLVRDAVVYVRQSTAFQVAQNLESQRRQHRAQRDRPGSKALEQGGVLAATASVALAQRCHEPARPTSANRSRGEVGQDLIEVDNSWPSASRADRAAAARASAVPPGTAQNAQPTCSCAGGSTHRLARRAAPALARRLNEVATTTGRTGLFRKDEGAGSCYLCYLCYLSRRWCGIAGICR